MIPPRGPEEGTEAAAGAAPAAIELAMQDGRLWGGELDIKVTPAQEFVLKALAAARPEGRTYRQLAESGLPYARNGNLPQLAKEACIGLYYKLRGPDGARLIEKQTLGINYVLHYLSESVVLISPDLLPRPTEPEPETPSSISLDEQ